MEHQVVGGGDAVEASTLGLPPGQWPEQLQWMGQVLRRDRFVRERGELKAVIYSAADGRTRLAVYND